ncbi:MAG: PAS domain-containing protein, partial [Neolewinella sp.]
MIITSTSLVDNPVVALNFHGLFSRLSVPMLLVEDSSKVVFLNAAAAGLFKMEPTELEGQFWSGLDGQLNQIVWKKRLKELDLEGRFIYDTDL